MNKYIGIALTATALLAQMQLHVCAQSQGQLESQMPQLQPAMSATPDTNLRGPMGGQTAAQSSPPQPFSTLSTYSYKEPANTGNTNSVNSSFESQASFTNPVPQGNPANPDGATSKLSTTSTRSATRTQKKHGFSPAGVAVGVPDRAVKSSLGLTDRTMKTGLGVTGKTTKEMFKAIF